MSVLRFGGGEGELFEFGWGSLADEVCSLFFDTRPAVSDWPRPLLLYLFSSFVQKLQSNAWGEAKRETLRS